MTPEERRELCTVCAHAFTVATPTQPGIRLRACRLSGDRIYSLCRPAPVDLAQMIRIAESERPLT
jgi:hypothetical protein